jgi:hypothetical protein
LLAVAAVTDQSKLPKDDGGQSLHEVVGCNGPEQLNNNNGHLQMGGGTTRASAKEVPCAAVQVDIGNMVFLLMAKATVVSATMSLSTVVLGASLLLGAWTMMIILGLSLLQQCPQQQQQWRVGSRVGGVPTMGTMLRHPSMMGSTFILGFHHFDFQVKQGELFWLYEAPT